VAVLFAVRPAGLSPAGGSPLEPGYGVPSFAPSPFEPLGPEGLFEGYSTLGTVTIGGAPGTLSVSRADDLVLPSGRVLAADAFYLDTPGFTIELPAGRHRILLLHMSGSSVGSTIAAAMVRVGDRQPVRWEGARTATSTGPEPFYYGVDSGTASFASTEAIERLRAMPADASSALVDQLVNAYSTGGDFKETASITVDPTSGANIVTFQSGYGDGGYPCWFGFDASGTAVALLTSFDLIDDPSIPTHSSAPGGSRPGSPVPPAP
jgi:hypothetical protein